MATNDHRLVILTSEEVGDLYGLPRFTDDERQLYFKLNASEQATAAMRRGSTGVYLVLQLGYFKGRIDRRANALRDP